MGSYDNRAHEFTLEEIAELLEDLNTRLQQRDKSISIFIVGGAAIAITGGSNARRTEDIDAIMRRDDQDLLLEEARAIAHERGLPDDWLNPNARMWMPPLPEHALQQHHDPGLHISYAEDAFLLATKLVAQRRKDASDIVELAARVGLQAPTAEELEDLIRLHYSNEDELALILGVSDVDSEVRHLAVSAARMLARRSGSAR